MSTEERVLSAPPVEPIDHNLSFGEVLLAALKRWNVKTTAQVEMETGRELTYGHLSRQCLSVVQGLKKEGIREGDAVAIVSYNSQEAHVILLAAMLLGATPAPLDPSLAPEEMSALLDIVGPKAVYTEGGKTLKKVESALALLELQPLIVVSGRSKHPYLAFQALLQPTDPEFRPVLKDPESHVALLLFTSGTSGLPKGVMLPDRYLIAISQTWPRKHEMVVLLSAPIFWLSGIMSILMSIALGFKTVFVRGPAKEAVILTSIQNYKANLWPTSPSGLQSLMAFPNRHAYDLSSLQWVLMIGSGASAETQLRFQRELFSNKTMVTQGYGMTETGLATISLPVPSLNKPGAVGMVKPYFQIKIEDPDTGESLGPEAEGELCIRGDNTMLGYAKDEEGTTRIRDQAGWIHTGDIGYYDEDGFIFIVDRIKDLIKYRSYQIAPGELENVLLSHPGVRDAAVIGVPHATDGEHPIAFVVALRNISENQLLDFVAERVSENKQIRGGVRFVEFIPRTSTGKSKRRNLRTQLLSELQGTNYIKMEWRKRSRSTMRSRSIQRTGSVQRSEVPQHNRQIKQAPP